jgi:hypothetical protein
LIPNTALFSKGLLSPKERPKQSEFVSFGGPTWPDISFPISGLRSREKTNKVEGSIKEEKNK